MNNKNLYVCFVKSILIFLFNSYIFHIKHLFLEKMIPNCTCFIETWICCFWLKYFSKRWNYIIYPLLKIGSGSQYHRILTTTIYCVSNYLFYIVTYYINWVTTSWTHSTRMRIRLFSPRIRIWIRHLFEMKKKYFRYNIKLLFVYSGVYFVPS